MDEPDRLGDRDERVRDLGSVDRRGLSLLRDRPRLTFRLLDGDRFLLDCRALALVPPYFAVRRGVGDLDRLDDRLPLSLLRLVLGDRDFFRPCRL